MTLDLSGVDLTTEVVRTDRLVLRPFRPDDAEAVFAGCQTEDIRQWISVIPSPYTREDAREFVTELAPGQRASGQGVPVAVEADGVLVGSSGLHFWPGRLGPEIGYWIAPEARGNGYAAETAFALAEWAFGLGVPRVHLWVDVDNAPSQATARRAGFTERSGRDALSAPSHSASQRQTRRGSLAASGLCTMPFCGTSVSRMRP